MSSLFVEILKRAQAEKRMLGVRSNSSDGRFSVGYVVNFSDEMVMLRVINRDGMPTGVQSFNMEDIFQIDFDDRYIRNIELKEDNLDKVYAGIKSPAFMEQEYLTIPLLLARAMEAQQLVFLATQVGPDLYGRIQQFTDEHVLLNCYTEYGEHDGLATIRVDNIRNFIWSDEDTRMIELHLKLQELRRQ
ncbi:hypothetical protein [Hymenobacter arizonensis]|uniref:Uncharacterized protein n=1 Tax=Hymenobacter arizonensis TaxID=1227077 RepID=A0A1I5TIJ1_HYMAR|nr:hypothetical protein [Hymenobacter arizonensis]SFP82879.1 hypothetical protein SAMN04515668_0490 [Hymenobacter arizonensis]